MADFMIYAVIAGLFIAVVAGPLGCFVVWRRMSYFGDTLAHSSLLGVALAILFGINLQLAIITSCAVFAGVLLLLERRQLLATILCWASSPTALWLLACWCCHCRIWCK